MPNRTVPLAALVAALAALAALSMPAALAADAARGRQLYETRCIACHETSVHSRARRVVADCRALRAEVGRWARQQGPAWTADEIDDVALWLDQRYYRFPPGSASCEKPVA